MKLIGLLFLAVLAVGCARPPGFQELDARASWTDLEGKTHYLHTVRFLSNVYADSTYKTVVGLRYFCLEDKKAFDLPKPGFLCAQWTGPVFRGQSR